MVQPAGELGEVDDVVNCVDEEEDLVDCPAHDESAANHQ